jgi:thymidylate kinase
MKLPGFSALKVLDDFVNCALCSNNPKPEDLNEHAKKARQALSSIRRYKIIQFYIVSFVRQAYRYWVEFKRRILIIYSSGRRRLPYGGMLVAVLGIDGSGKTTAVERLEKDFAVQINVTRVFLGNGKSGSSWFRRILFFIFGARARWKAHRKMRRSDSKTEKRNVPWYYLLWMCLCLFDKRKNLASALSGRANGTLVLSDRWPQSQIKNNHDGPRIYGMGKVKGFTAFVAGREHSLLKKVEMIPPDIIFRLIVSPDTAMKRKPGEFTYEEAKRNMGFMCQIEWPQSLVVDVDAEQSCEEVHNRIATIIWKHLCGRSIR